MRQNEDGEWELDPQHFKVVCQKCGQVGEIDIYKPAPPFSLEVGYMPSSVKGMAESKWDYYLCRSCDDELNPRDYDDSREVD